MGMQNRDSNMVETAVHLSVIEVGLGSLLHSLHVPFAGHVLSLNQGAFIEHSVSKDSSRTETFEYIINTSLCVAIIKSLSPAGKKLGPMISISTQGFLLALGHIILGNNILGKMLGMALLSLWAFVQPFVTYVLMYGPDLFQAIEYMLAKIEKNFSITPDKVYLTLLMAILIKLIVAMSLPFFSQKLVPLIQSRVKNQTQTTLQKKKSFWRKHGLVIFSFILMGGFYFMHGKDLAQTMWYMLRPLSILIIMTYISKAVWIRKYLFSRLAHLPFFKNLKSTLDHIKNN